MRRGKGGSDDEDEMMPAPPSEDSDSSSEEDEERFTEEGKVGDGLNPKTSKGKTRVPNASVSLK